VRLDSSDLMTDAFRTGWFSVPTDYDNPSAGTSRLALTNYPATCSRSERLGIIITNVSPLDFERKFQC
jgi:hypothetical protein